MPLLMLLIIPVLGYATYFWLNSIINEELLITGQTAREFCSPAGSQIWLDMGLSINDWTSLCEEIWPIFLLGDGSLWTGIASVFFFLIIIVLSKFCGTNRKRLAATFSVLVPFSLLFVSANTLVQGSILTYSLFLVQVELMGSWFPVLTLGLGLGALIVAGSVVMATLSISRKISMSQMAVRADKADYPQLWSFVQSVAARVGAPQPDNIAIGLEPTFYATSANVKVLSTGSELSGETLYVSLPLMRLFTTEEFAAVVGHELGHFKGGDVQYTIKFAPLYRALNKAVQDTAKSEKITALPALAVLSFLLNKFSSNEREISRIREFEADKSGAKATSEADLSAALVKVTAFSQMWSNLGDEVSDSLDWGRAVTNLSKLYASKVAFDTDAEATKKVIQANLQKAISHPTDTHPTLSERLIELNGTDEVHSFDLGYLEDSSINLIKEAEELEQELTTVQQKVYQLTGQAEFGIKMPENSESAYGIARIIQIAAAVMVCADGKVEPAEIADAEAKGKKLVSYFNSLEFREACLSPKTLPSVSHLSKLAKEVFNDEAINELKDFLTSIAEADGEVSAEEKVLIDAFAIK
jgi:Zn-dependent protease with chaperone function